jgi:formylmethanofuran dehydrogenase subunit C
MTLVLRLVESPVARVDAAVLRPDALAGLGPGDVARLPLRHGRRLVRVGDLFTVSGAADLDVRVAGDLRRLDRLGEGMAAGRLTIDGSAGDHVGAGMSGGAIVVQGDVGDFAGAEMRGGLLRVLGRARDGLAGVYAGSRVGMRGGEVLVNGDAGAEAGAGMRRGLVAVGGRVGDAAGYAMLAGTMIGLRGFAAAAGERSRRGTLVSAGPVAIPSTYSFACHYRPPALRLVLLRLRALGMPFDEWLLEARWARWSGDRLELARGEILTLVGDR